MYVCLHTQNKYLVYLEVMCVSSLLNKVYILMNKVGALLDLKTACETVVIRHCGIIAGTGKQGAWQGLCLRGNVGGSLVREDALQLKLFGITDQLHTHNLSLNIQKQTNKF